MGVRKDEEVPRLQYLRMVNVIWSLELFLQCAPIPLHPAADGTGQVTLTVQVTCGDRGKMLGKRMAQMMDWPNPKNLLSGLLTGS